MKLMWKGLAATALAAALVFTAAPPARTQSAGKTLTVVLNSNVNTYDPHMSATVGTDLSVISHIYPALITRGPDLKLQGELATEWKLVDDTTWRFKLVKGATFQNGEKLDAAAVKWNMDRVRDPKVNARIKPWFDPVADVKVLAEDELEVTTKKPYPAFAAQLSMFFLLPPQWAAGAKPASEWMPGGAYEIKELKPGDRIVLAARPGYFGKKPAFDSVVFRIVPEVSARISALIAGEVDIVTGVPPSEFERINKSGKAKAGAVDSIRTFMVRFNNLVPPFKDNVKLRQAVNYAVDKKAIVDAILGGHGKVADCQILSKDYFGYNADLKPYPYDPAKAKALLKEAGITTPITIEFDIPTGVYLLSQEVTQAIAAQLEEVGIKVKMTEMEFGAFMAKYLREKKLAPMGYLSLAWPTLDADGLLSFFEKGNQYAYWDDEPFTKLLAEARTTADPEKRKALFKQATQRSCDEAPVLWLFTQPATYGVASRVEWKARGDDWMRAFDFAAK